MRFDSCHPVINLIYFAGAIASAAVFDHPVFVAIAYASAFMYSVKLRGVRGLVTDLCLIPLIFGYTWLYSYYNHFGVTSLGENLIGNHITLEAVVYGLQTGVSAAVCGDAGVMPVCDIFSRQGRLSFRAHITEAVAVSLDNPEVPAETCETGRQGGWRSGRCRKRAQAGSIVETRSELRANGFRAHHLVHGEHRGKRTVHEKPRLLAERPHGVFHIQIRQQRQELCRVHIPVRHADDDGCDAGSDPYLL